MFIQVLLSIGQDRLSKEEAGKLLDQRVYVLSSTQELRHSTWYFVKLAGNYFGAERPIFLLMETWPRHIDRFERQYDKAFAKRSYLWGGFDGSYPQMCLGIFTLLQHNRHRGSGVRFLHVVWGDS